VDKVIYESRNVFVKLVCYFNPSVFKRYCYCCRDCSCRQMGVNDYALSGDV